MRYFSTFSGIAGFELGIQQAYEDITNQYERPDVHQEHSRNFKGRSQQKLPTCIGYSEIDKYAVQVYQKHFPNHKNYGDITQLRWEEVPDFDLLVGGFPCQAFSIAGKRKGFEDTRGTLFFEVAKGLQIKQPNFALLENVKGLVSHDKGNTLETILLSLQELGYYVNIEVYNSKDFGVPQNRERIIFVCRHLKTLIQDGENLNLNISRQIISEYLFQILLNNLAEVKKLQETKSKDWVIGYLLWKEINQNILNQDTEESTKDGTTTPTEESVFQWQAEEVWQNIDTLLSNNLEGSSPEKNTYTTLTAIKGIIDSKTYTYSQMLKAILLATAHLRSSFPNLWNEVLSDLIVIKENTKYARLNDKKEEVVISETGNAYLTKDIQADGQFIAFANLRGTPRPQVFPIGSPDKEVEGNPEIRQLNHPTHSNDRVYGSDGIAPTLNTMQGGRRQPKIVGGLQGHQTAKEDGIAPCLTTAMGQGGGQTPIVWSEEIRIRRLTPTECERLQGFPDGWTAEGTEGKVSDTQRYKMCGNAVTVNVIQAICERLLR